MNLSAEALLIMAAKGLSLEDVAAIVKANEPAEKPRTSAAKRQARYRQRQAEASQSDVTRDVTDPLKDNSNPQDSVSDETGVPPANPVKGVFDLGVSILVGCGHAEKQARSLVGKWRKGKSDAEVLTGLLDCQRLNISSPVEWLERRFKGAKYVSKSGYEYRGTIEQVIREAERRNDMDTYWKAKGDLKREAA